MGPHAVDQIGFKGTVYAEIRKSIFYNIFDLVQLHGLLALYYECRRYCSIRCDTSHMYAEYIIIKPRNLGLHGIGRRV